MSLPLQSRNMHAYDTYAQALTAAYRAGWRLYDPDLALQEESDAWEKVRRDPVIAQAVDDRLHSIAGKPWRLLPAREESIPDKKVAAILTDLFERIERFTESRYHLASAFMRARSYAFIEGRRQAVPVLDYPVGIKWWFPRRLRQVDRRRIQIVPDWYDCPKTGQQRVRSKLQIHSVVRGFWEDIAHPEWFVKHVYNDEESRLGHGRGLMEAIWFYWYAKEIVLREGLQGLERWAQGLVLVGVEGTRDASTGKPNEEVVKAWLETVRLARARHAIVYEKGDEVQAAPQGQGRGHEMVTAFLEYLDQAITRLIAGALLPLGGGDKGAGSLARAAEEAETIEKSVQYDRKLLDETIDRDLVRAAFTLNRPAFVKLGLGDARMPRFSTMQDKRINPKDAIEVATGMVNMGAPVKKEELYDLSEMFTPPGPDDEVIGGPEQLLSFVQAGQMPGQLQQPPGFPPFGQQPPQQEEPPGDGPPPPPQQAVPAQPAPAAQSAASLNDPSTIHLADQPRCEEGERGGEFTGPNDPNPCPESGGLPSPEELAPPGRPDREDAPPGEVQEGGLPPAGPMPPVAQEIIDAVREADRQEMFQKERIEAIRKAESPSELDEMSRMVKDAGERGVYSDSVQQKLEEAINQRRQEIDLQRIGEAVVPGAVGNAIAGFRRDMMQARNTDELDNVEIAVNQHYLLPGGMNIAQRRELVNEIQDRRIAFRQGGSRVPEVIDGTPKQRNLPLRVQRGPAWADPARRVLKNHDITWKRGGEMQNRILGKLRDKGLVEPDGAPGAHPIYKEWAEWRDYAPVGEPVPERVRDLLDDPEYRDPAIQLERERDEDAFITWRRRRKEWVRQQIRDANEGEAVKISDLLNEDQKQEYQNWLHARKGTPMPEALVDALGIGFPGEADRIAPHDADWNFEQRERRAAEQQAVIASVHSEMSRLPLPPDVQAGFEEWAAGPPGEPMPANLQEFLGGPVKVDNMRRAAYPENLQGEEIFTPENIREGAFSEQLDERAHSIERKREEYREARDLRQAEQAEQVNLAKRYDGGQLRERVQEVWWGSRSGNESRQEAVARLTADADRTTQMEELPIDAVKGLDAGTTSDTYWTQFADGTRAMTKPEFGEEAHLRDHIEGGTYWMREVAASQVFDKRNVVPKGMIPTTVARRFIDPGSDMVDLSLLEDEPDIIDPFEGERHDAYGLRDSAGSYDRHGVYVGAPIPEAVDSWLMERWKDQRVEELQGRFPELIPEDAEDYENWLDEEMNRWGDTLWTGERKAVADRLLAKMAWGRAQNRFEEGLGPDPGPWPKSLPIEERPDSRFDRFGNPISTEQRRRRRFEIEREMSDALFALELQERQLQREVDRENAARDILERIEYNREEPGEPQMAAYQDEVENASTGGMFLDRHQLESALAFDTIFANSDRHERNWMTDEMGNAFLIDNGLGMPTRPDLIRAFYVPDSFEYHGMTQDEEIPESVKAPWRSIEENEQDIIDELDEIGIEPDAISEYQHRLRHFLQMDTWGEWVEWLESQDYTVRFTRPINIFGF